MTKFHSGNISREQSRVFFIIGSLLMIIGFMMVVRWVLVIDKLSPDFGQDYAAARGLLNEVSIYEVDPKNNHPPTTAIIFLPFAFLAYLTALQLWTVLSTILYLFVLLCIVRSLGIFLPKVGWFLGLGIALCWYPFQAHLALGQISIILIACLIGGWVLLQRKQDYWAGLLFALAFIIKLFPGLIFVYLFVRQKWKALTAATIFTVVGWLTTVLLVGIEDTTRYFREVAPYATGVYTLFPINISMAGIIARLFMDGSWVQPIAVWPEAVVWLTMAFNLGLFALLALHLWSLPTTKQGENTAFAITCIAMPLLSPISWQHIYPLLLLPMGILFADALNQEGRKRSLALGKLLIIFTFLSLPDIQLGNYVMALYAPYRMTWYAGLLFALPTLAICVLWYMLWRNFTEVYGRE
jgi:alpha-1,2-mannosyltransferase